MGTAPAALIAAGGAAGTGQYAHGRLPHTIDAPNSGAARSAADAAACQLASDRGQGRSAADRGVGVHQVGVGPVRVPLQQQVGQLDQHGAVAVERVDQRVLQVRPGRLAVQRGGHPVQQQGAACHLAGAELLRQRPGIGPNDQGLELTSGILPQRAAGARAAPRGERAERGLEPFGLDGVGLQARRVRVHRAVQDQRPDPVREQLGVPGAQVGAVGLAQVGEPGLAERGAEHVQVAGRVLGADVGQQRPGVLLAPGRVELALPNHGGELRGVVRHLVGGQVLVQLRAGHAGQRGLAAAHPARVEADDVEPGPHGGREFAARRERVLHARAARAARVDHQVADAAGGVGGRELDDRQGEARPAGAGVVEGNQQAGALEAVVAGLPGQVLRVVGGGRGRQVVRDR